MDQKLNAKGIGFGTEGAFAPWWDDLYNKTVMKTSLIKVEKLKENKEKKKKKDNNNNNNNKKVEKLILNDKKQQKQKKKKKDKYLE